MLGGPSRKWGPGIAPELGGKGASLDRLRRAGLPVPGGFVVPAQVARTGLMLGAGPHLERLARAAARSSAEEPWRLVDEEEGLQSQVRDLHPQIEAALAGWKPSPGRWFVVRSSAPQEDGVHTSFAGVLTSYLGVERVDLGRAVVLCWAAVYSPTCRAYCSRNGFAPEEISPAVVVQEVTNAATAGILLTRDPTAGAESPQGPVIEAVRGLGGAAVGGEVQPESHRSLGEGQWEVCGARQDWSEVLTAAGVRRRRLTQEEKSGPFLSNSQRDELVRLGRKVERLTGVPQDIEWAIDSGDVRLLQARPITTLPRERVVWTRANSIELYPEVVSPMTASLIERVQRAWLLDYFTRRGFEVRHFGVSMSVVNGRPYLNESLLQHMADAAGVKMDRVRQKLGGDRTSAGDTGGWDWRRALRSARPLLSMMRGYLAAARRAREALAQSARDADDLMRRPLEPLPDSALVAGALDCYQRQRPLHDATADVAGAIEVWTSLCAWLLRGVTKSPARYIAAAAREAPEGPSAGQVDELQKLIALAREDSRVREALSRLNGAAPPEPAGFDGTAFGAALDAFLQKYGWRSLYESDSSIPRYVEDPAPVLRAIKTAALSEDQNGSPHSNGMAPPVEPDGASRCRSELRPGRRARKFLSDRLLRHVSRLYALRQELRPALSVLVAAQRRVELTLADRWASRGWLDHRDDYYMLRVEDAEIAAAQPAPETAAWLHACVERGRAKQAGWAAVEMPLVWTRDLPQSKPGSTATPVPDGAMIRGLPISPGIAEGEVVVLTSPDDQEEIRPGCILVTPTVGPAWAPLFASIAGLVVEVGGVLSHGSILAREFGLPAVANIAGATRALRTGDRIRIDGTRGIVWNLNGSERPQSGDHKSGESGGVQDQPPPESHEAPDQHRRARAA